MFSLSVQNVFLFKDITVTILNTFASILTKCTRGSIYKSTIHRHEGSIENKT